MRALRRIVSSVSTLAVQKFERPRFMHLAFTELPVIDVGPLVNANASLTERQEVGNQLHEACRDVGFFYIKNHGVPEEVSLGVLKEARRWFTTVPEDKKLAIALSPETHYRGYQPLGANVTRYEGGYVRDWHEGIDLYKEVSEQELAVLPPSPIHGMNQWPYHVPEFEKSLRRYIDACLGLGSSMMRGIALGLGLQETAFDSMADNSYWVCRAIYYPPLLNPPTPGENSNTKEIPATRGQDTNLPRSAQLSCGEHCDYGCWTFVNQEQGVTALQVQNAAGQWVDAPPLPGTFVCNIGDLMRVWSAGLYTPTLHRVINAAPGQDRVSIPFFYESNFDAVVAPFPELLEEGAVGGQDILPVRYGDHLESKVLRNFEL